MELTNKIEAFKKHFDIESEIDVEFSLDKKNNLVAKFQDREYILNNTRSKNKFLSYDSMKYAKNYGTEFLRAIQLEKPKKGRRVKEPKKKKKKKHTDKQLLISHYKRINKIRPEWDIESYGDFNEFRELILDEKCCKIPKKFKPFKLFSLGDDFSLIRYYRFKFGLKLLEFLGVNTPSGHQINLRRAYEEDLKYRSNGFDFLSMVVVQIEAKANMHYDGTPFQYTEMEKQILSE